MVMWRHVTHPTVEFDGSLQRSSGVDGAEVIETREYGTVQDRASYIDLGKLLKFTQNT